MSAVHKDKVAKPKKPVNKWLASVLEEEYISDSSGSNTDFETAPNPLSNPTPKKQKIGKGIFL